MLKHTDDTEPTEGDQRVFAKLVPPDRSLRRLKPRIDVERCRALVKDGSSAAMGRTAADPVRLITRECWPLHDHLSEREVMAAGQVHGAGRWFRDLSLERRVPVPRVLAPCRPRVGRARPQGRLDPVVTQARAHGLMHDRWRRKDAPPMVAHLAVPTTRPWGAQRRQRRLERARPSGPEPGAQEATAAERLRPVTADRQDVERLGARVAPLQTMVQGAERRQQEWGPAPEPPERARQACTAAWALAHRVLAERDAPARGDPGRRGVDPEARRGTHGRSVEGYRLASRVAADRERWGAVEGLAGHGDDAREAQTRWAAEAQAPSHDMAALSMDGMDWHGAVWRTLSAAEGAAVEGYVPPRAAPTDGPSCGPEPFRLDAATGVLTCPGGHQTASTARQSHDTGWTFPWARRTWATWAWHAQGLAAVPPHQGRRVINTDDPPEDEAARARATTEVYVEVRRQHPRVERTRAARVCHHRGRRTRSRGRWRVRRPSVLIGMVVTITRLVKWLSPQRAPTIPQPVYAPGARDKERRQGAMRPPAPTL